MGSATAQAFANEVTEGNCPLEVAVQYHLQTNHYPKPPSIMVDPCLDAISAANDGEYDRQINLPIGVSWRGQTSVEARVLIQSFHLDAFIANEG